MNIKNMNNQIGAIVILGGGLKKDKNGWRTVNFDERDNFGALGDRLRVVAGKYLYARTRKNNPDVFIIVLGGKGQLKNIKGAPAVAEVLKKELMGLGVPSKKIIEEKKSGNTFEQLLALNKIIAEKDLRNIMLVSNHYHLPRIKTFFKYYSNKLRFLSVMLAAGNLKLISAEKVCVDYDKDKWYKITRKAYASERMKKRMLLEKQGIKDIKEGRYKI